MSLHIYIYIYIYINVLCEGVARPQLAFNAIIGANPLPHTSPYIYKERNRERVRERERERERDRERGR